MKKPRRKGRKFTIFKRNGKFLYKRKIEFLAESSTLKSLYFPPLVPEPTCLQIALGQ